MTGPENDLEKIRSLVYLESESILLMSIVSFGIKKYDAYTCKPKFVNI